MSRLKKKLVLWILILLVLSPILLVALQKLANRVINQESIRNNIEAAISRDLGGQLTYKQVTLSVLPRPRVVVQYPELSIPGGISGTLKSLDIHFEFLSLLTGNPRIAKVLLNQPDIMLSPQEGTRDQSSRKPPVGGADILGLVASRMPALVIEIKQGRWTFLQNEQKRFSLQEVAGHIAFVSAAQKKDSFRIIGDIQGDITEVESLPGPVRIAVQQFEALPDSLSFSDGQVRISDTSFTVTGTLDGYLATLQKMELSFSGTLGSNTLQWIRTAASLPPDLTIHTPFTVSQAHLHWNQNGTARLEGSASVGRGPALSFNVEQNPDGIIVKELRLQDKESQATVALSLQKKVLDLSFAGNLTQSTLNNLFEHRRLRFGWLRGDFRARIVLDRPIESTAQGILEGEGLVLPVQLKVPVTLEHISLHAADRTATLDPVVISLGTNRHTIKGQVTASENEWFLDLTTDGLEWEPLHELFGSDKSEDESSTPAQWHMPVRATIRLSTEYLTAGKWVARPFRADISLTPDAVQISLNEARVCGLNLPGTMTFTSSDLQLELKPAASHQDLQSTLECFVGKEFRMSGTFDLTGTLSFRGPQQDLIKNLQGTMTFTAKDGRTYQDSVAVRVLTYLNVTDLLRGSFPDPGTEGVPYDSLTIKANIANRTLVLQESAMITPLMNIAGRGSVNLADLTLDITVLVAPFKTTDAMIQKVPLLRNVLAGSLMTIPILIKGPFKQPKVTAIPPSEVAEGLVDTMQRTLKLPFKIIEPIIPKRKGSTKSS